MSVLDLPFSDKEIFEHVKRIHTATFNTYDLADVVRYIEEKTYLNGERFSFKDHEFQKDILSDTAKDVYCQKCAQVGMSEAMARYALAICRVMPYFNTILTMPGANDTSNFFKTRLDPIINDSPDLLDCLNTAVNNTEVKNFGGSFLYGRGTRGSTAALSVPADLVIHDELDRSDPATIQQYQSRLKHSSWKMTRKFGTPMGAGVGISLVMDQSLRHRHMVKCHCCNHWFAPSYHENVVIPGYYGEKKEISAHNLHQIAWQKAYVECPKCGKEPDLGPEHRAWVIENSQDNFDAHGYFVTPFSVPRIVPTARIVEESTKFSWSEFLNQTLGETSTEESSSLVESDILACRHTSSDLRSGDLHAMGIDLGATCYFTIGRQVGNRYVVVRRERASLAQFHETKERLMAQYSVLTHVWDWQPYTDLVIEAQKYDKNLYAGRYVMDKDAEIVSIISKEELEKEGKMGLLTAKISRNIHFDDLMRLIKGGLLVWAAQDETEDNLFVKQMLDMKRVLVPDRFGEGHYEWVKNVNDQDHYHHSLGYMITACRLMGTASTAFPVASVPIARRIKIASRQETEAFGLRRQ
jgi:hypothetical protein